MAKSAISTGTVRMRIVLVWKLPPFQPWTAMMVDPGWIILRSNALLSPKLSLFKEGLAFDYLDCMKRNVPDSIVDINLPLLCWNTTRFGIPEWIAASMQVDLTSSLLISCN